MDPKQYEVTFKYFLPEHEAELWLASNASKMWSLLYDLDQKCRSVLKYEENPLPGRTSLAQEIRELIDGEINLDGIG